MATSRASTALGGPSRWGGRPVPATGLVPAIPVQQPVKKVVVADDQAAGRELIRAVLERCGHKVWEAADGTEAVRFATEVMPDLILLDLHMPILDGFGALAQLRLDGNLVRTPIIALTATAMKGDRERALSAGFTSYISKPISLHALRSEMERWLG